MVPTIINMNIVMNKNDFFFFNAVDGEFKPLPAIVKKESITAIIQMEDGRGCIAYGDSSYFLTEDSYEDILIQLFNQ